MTAGADRRAELAVRLGELRVAIGLACAAAKRNAGDVTMIAVTKTFPVDDAAILVQLGVADLGENRDQDAKAKAAELAATLTTTLPATAPGPVRWHFVGQLQTNKAKSVAQYAAAVHSVDRISLVDALADAVTRLGREPIQAFIQVNLDDAAGRGGARPDDVASLADRIAAAPGLALTGVMAVAPLGADPRPAFDRLVALSHDLRREHPDATAVSAGMSGDFAEAVAAGATHLRIGSALLGPRVQVVS